MGISTGLTLVLVAAKLFGYQHYSWLVAFSPYIISLVLATAYATLLKVDTSR